MLFEKVPKLRVAALSDLVITHPNREEDERDPDDLIAGVDATGNPVVETPRYSERDRDRERSRERSPKSNGTLLEGKVVLTLPTARKVEKLKVEFVSCAQ